MRGASVSSCVVLWLFCGWGAAEGLTRKVSSLLATSRSGAPGGTVGEVEDLRKDACVHRVWCDSRFTRACACRACVE